MCTAIATDKTLLTLVARSPQPFGLCFSKRGLEIINGFQPIRVAYLAYEMNTASKLGPHTQTDRGTCPGVGL